MRIGRSSLLEVRAQGRFYAVKAHLMPESSRTGGVGGDVYFVGAEEAVGIGGFATATQRHDEGDLDTVVGEAFDEAVAGYAEAASDTWGKLPAQHEDSHRRRR